MIWILHYILFNAGLASVLCLKSVFLKHYCTETSISEIGVLLMALPFIATFAKPICCAMADRLHAHKACFMLSILIVAICYGSLTIPCFFEQFMKQNARLVWYIYVVLIIIGYSAFGVVFCLADTLSLNLSIQRGISWGYFRIWAVISWGVCGLIVGTFNETPLMPRYTPGFLVMSGCCLIELVVMTFYSNKYFQCDDDSQLAAAASDGGHGFSSKQQQHDQSNNQDSFQHPQLSQLGRSDSKSFNDSASCQYDSGTFGRGSTARLNPRLLAAIANVVVEEVGSNLKSSLRLTSNPVSEAGGSAGAAALSKRQRTPLQELIGVEALAAAAKKRDAAAAANQEQASTTSTTPTTITLNDTNEPANSNQQQVGNAAAIDMTPALSSPAKSASNNSSSGLAGTIGRAALRRAQLGVNRMNSLSSASGIAILDDLRHFNTNSQSNLSKAALDNSTGGAGDNLLMNTLKQHHMDQQQQQQQVGQMGSFSRASGKHLAPSAQSQQQHELMAAIAASSPPPNAIANNSQLNLSEILKQQDSGKALSVEEERKMGQDLQLVLLRLMLKRNKSILRYLLVFVMMGSLMYTHLTYFFMHAEQLAHQLGYDFSQIAGLYLLSHAVSEVFSFIIIAQFYMPRVGRVGSIMTAAMVCALNFVYYGFFIADYSLYWGFVTEMSHGINYGIMYSLLSDLARESVDQVETYLPELISLGLVDPRINPIYLKLPLRATMQGIFSGAFDGFGNGLGVFVSALYLENHSYVALWQWSCALSVALFLIHPLTECSSWPIFAKRRAASNAT